MHQQPNHWCGGDRQFFAAGYLFHHIDLLHAEEGQQFLGAVDYLPGAYAGGTKWLGIKFEQHHHRAYLQALSQAVCLLLPGDEFAHVQLQRCSDVPGPLDWEHWSMLQNSFVSNPVISARRLLRSYGSTHALNGIDVDIAAGAAVAIMGPSGSGKSTLLHALAGIELPDSGTVTLNLPGQAPVGVDGLGDSARTKLRREAFGFVFQSGLLIPELTAEENVAMALMVNGVPRTAAIARAVDALQQLGLAGMEQRRIGQLSGGQQQRVAIARAQVTGAGVVFADEPTGALDSVTGSEVLDVLMQCTVGMGKSLVMVTHDRQVAQRCHRILTLQDGKITSDDSVVHGPRS